MNMFSSKNTRWRDTGPEPVVENIQRAAMNNEDAEKTFWTGKNLQVKLMTIPVGADSGTKIHSDEEQIICILDGFATVFAGDCEHNMRPIGRADSSAMIIIPSNKWYSISNIGRRPLRLYSVCTLPLNQSGAADGKYC